MQFEWAMRTSDTSSLLFLTLDVLISSTDIASNGLADFEDYAAQPFNPSLLHSNIVIEGTKT